jgi:5'-deoxynucleotidase YfbR-like HD superfamily hydrolase
MKIQSFLGEFDFDNPEIKLREISHNLSRINRYNGATKVPFSVANHIKLGYQLIEIFGLPNPQNFKLAWLLHDAHEAYLGDINGLLLQELKKNNITFLHDLAKKLDQAIAAKFGMKIALFYSEGIKFIDGLCLYFETKVLFDNRPAELWEYLDKTVETNMQTDLREATISSFAEAVAENQLLSPEEAEAWLHATIIAEFA